MEASARALELEGLRLDETYTAKTFAAVRDFIAAPVHARATVLYWHTYHSAVDSAPSQRTAAAVDVPGGMP